MQDNIDLQKHATPVPTPASVEETFAFLDTKKINAVVNEKSRGDAVDINARHNAVLQYLVDNLEQKDSTDHLRTERVEVKTGNAMIDHLVPWYFGVALFKVFVHTMQVFLICQSLNVNHDIDAPKMLLALRQVHGCKLCHDALKLPSLVIVSLDL